MKLRKSITVLTSLILAISVGALSKPLKAYADTSGFSVSPMKQRMVLTRGETYRGTFKVTNPGNSQYDLNYELSVVPVSVDDETYSYSFDKNAGDYNQIVDWINLKKKVGKLVPNSTDEIEFSIVVPEDAPAGGQYAAIAVTSGASDGKENAVNIENRLRISHLIYAEVAGETVRKGDITDVNVTSFLFSGKITGTSRITNEGNVHADATYTLRVFPLFSSEEVYTNEENPESKIILPASTRAVSTSWDETPSIGIFHVIYNVEFEGVKSSVDKYVIVCPIWLLFLILIGIFLTIFRILSVKKKTEKK